MALCFVSDMGVIIMIGKAFHELKKLLLKRICLE